jgi:prepilin-type N-terminal cleavage/methylation domain-containing protein
MGIYEGVAAIKETSRLPADCVRKRKLGSAHGFTLLEIIISLVLASGAITIAVAMYNARPLNLGADTQDLVLNLQVARELAVSRTEHYRLRALTTTAPYQYVIEGFNGTLWVTERTITLRPNETFTSATLGTIAEFDTRGVLVTVPAPVVFTLYDTPRKWTKQVTVNAVGMVAKP